MILSSRSQTKYFRIMELTRMAFNGYTVEELEVRALQMCKSDATVKNYMDEVYRRVQQAVHEPDKHRRFIN